MTEKYHIKDFHVPNKSLCEQLMDEIAINSGIIPETYENNNFYLDSVEFLDRLNRNLSPGKPPHHTRHVDSIIITNNQIEHVRFYFKPLKA
jgi:hypothetical protein